MRVSVVMTVFNQAEYLREAIDSVLAQHCQDFELIVVDDGSTDDSAKVAESYGSKVRVIRRPNGGLGAARNTGIERARGEFVTFCDSDDIHLPHRLSSQLAVLEKTPRAALCFSDLSPYRDGRVLSESLLREKVLGPVRRSFDEEIEAAFASSATCEALGVPVPDEYRSRPVRWGRAPGLIALTHVAWGGASMYRRAALAAMGGHDVSLKRYVDWELSSRLSKAYELAFLDVPVLLYRIHEGQLTKKTRLGLECYRRIIDQVWRSDPVAYAQHHEVIDRCLGSSLWGMGKVSAEEGDWSAAAGYYLSSVRTYPKQKAAYLDLAKAWVSSVVGR